MTVKNWTITTRYTHAHRVPHAKHVESSKWRSLKCGWDDGVLFSAYPVHRSASKVNRLVAKVQVISCRRYFVFYSFVE